jgi:hypothetical protein
MHHSRPERHEVESFPAIMTRKRFGYGSTRRWGKERQVSESHLYWALIMLASVRRYVLVNEL